MAFGAYLTNDEIRLLAPFIDAWMTGDITHDLPAYSDTSNRVLAAFKARMIARGIWLTEGHAPGGGNT